LAVVNLDDEHAAQMIRAARGARVLTYGFNRRAEVRAEALDLRPQSSNFRLRTPGGSVFVRLPLLGAYNVSNALAAAALGVGLKVPLNAIRAGLQKVKAVPGRMEKIPGAQPFSVLVDFAHKPDALEKVLRSARAWTSGKLLVVFGCGGERDQEKRPLMGEIGVRLADVVVLTSDNPRSEDPDKIITQMQAGCRRAGRPGIVEPDRRRAIRWALQNARPGDTVLLAGKGHESYQYMKDGKLAFNDHQVALRELKKLGY
jgi:UDP-N-acetylmuramoyl-L-alanyl-D-glutamate--2,6-diaminopimelate ligase